MLARDGPGFAGNTYACMAFLHEACVKRGKQKWDSIALAVQPFHVDGKPKANISITFSFFFP